MHRTSPIPKKLFSMSFETKSKAERIFFREAIARAVSEEMIRDDRLVLIGQDVGDFGGSYKEFVGLFDRFGPSRVRDTPVAEASMVGLGVGLAAAGMRAIVSVTYMDFLMLGLDPLVNYAAKARFKTAGQITAPLVVKTTSGARGQGVAHSQCIEAWLMAVPGLRVVSPSNPADAYGLMKSAIRSDGPVLYIDHKRLFPIAGELSDQSDAVPIGAAKTRRHGQHVTITAHSYMVRVALEAAERLAATGISSEVIDLRSLSPLDIDAIVKSVARTGALVTLEEGQLTCGIGAEIAYQVRERIDGVRIARVGAKAAPVSSNPILESACLPDAVRLLESVKDVLNTR